MKLRPFFSYFGGKWRIAPKYPAPRYDLIIEPFAGSAGYALRHFERNVLLVDAYAPVVETWRYLITADPNEIIALPDLKHGQSVDDLDVPQGARYLIGWWLNAGNTTPCKTLGAWARQYAEGSQLFWGPRCRARIADQVPFIRHWRVEQGSFADIPDIEATWFVDPPYQVRGTSYPKSAREIDFDALGRWCQARRGQAMVCENEGAAWLPFAPFVAAKATHGKHRTGRSAEVLWTNDMEQGVTR